MQPNNPHSILHISGAEIAGPRLAYRLLQYGMEPTIIEEAPRLRTGGYLIDFWGAGYDIADRMGLLPEITSRGVWWNRIPKSAWWPDVDYHHSLQGFGWLR